MKHGRYRWFELPDAPAIPALRFRFYAGEADIPSMVGVINAFNEATGEVERWDVETLGNDLRHPTHIPPQEGILLGFVGETMIAYSSVEFSDTTDGERHYRSHGSIHPDWMRRGIGGAMLADAERRLVELAREQAYPGPRRIITWLDDGDAGGLALVQQRGYERVRVYHHMTRPHLEDIDIAPLPEGVVARPATRAEMPRVFDAAAEAFRDHFGGHDFSDAARRRWLEDPLTNPDLMMTAFAGDEIIAGVQGLIDPVENEAHGYLRGWTDPVFTRRPWRRQGLAYALIGRSLRQLREQGMTSAQLGVDSQNENRALALYQSHGYVVDRSASEWHKRLESA